MFHSDCPRTKSLVAEREQSSSETVHNRSRTKPPTFTDSEIAGNVILIAFCIWLQTVFYAYITNNQIGLVGIMLIVLACTASAMALLLVIALIASCILTHYAPHPVHAIASFCERYPQYIFYSLGVLYLVGVIGYDIAR